MLALTLRDGETVTIEVPQDMGAEIIRVRCTRAENGRVLLAFDAPRHIAINRDAASWAEPVRREGT